MWKYVPWNKGSLIFFYFYDLILGNFLVIQPWKIHSSKGANQKLRGDHKLSIYLQNCFDVYKEEEHILFAL